MTLRAMSDSTTESTKLLNSDYYVEGYAAKFEPYVLGEVDGVPIYEKIEKDALKGADVSDVIMLYDHEGRVVARTANDTLIVKVDDVGIFIAADLGQSEASRELYNEISVGLVNRMSWAFTVSDESYDRDTRTRHIRRIKKVYDVSAVSIPANDDTTISARSSVTAILDADKAESDSLERRRKSIKLKIRLSEGEM